MKEVLIMGIGSRIMKDDGIGIYLVEDLAQHLRNSNIEFIIGETDIDYCISAISGGKRVVVIDAFLSGKTPGEETVLPLYALKKGHDAGYSLHGIHILHIMQRLQHELEGILIGIEPYEISRGFCLSDTLKSSYPDIFAAVYRHVDRYITQYEG